MTAKEQHVSVPNEGLAQFVAEVARRGGTATRAPGRETLLDVVSGSGRTFRIKLKTKVRGDWQGRKSDFQQRPGSKQIHAWVFVDITKPASQACIVEAGWMQRTIQADVEAWLAADSTRDAAKQDHHKIPEPQVAEWRGRWDLLDLAEAAKPSSAVSMENLGAWVFKCNPETWDFEAYVADGNHTITDWSVVDNYRSEMIEHGQRALFWLSGPEDGAFPRGFWGFGWTTGPRQAAAVSEQGYWVDDNKRRKVRWFADTDITLMEQPVKAADLRSHPGLSSLEVLRSPQGSNPSWVSKQELAELEKLLPQWPDLGAETGAPITVHGGGAGFGDPATNKLVELEAVDAVTAHYRALGYKVTDVSSQNLGWDLTCTHRKDVVRVEVKGVAGRAPTVLLTRNEIRSAREDSNWTLAVVTKALTNPTVTIYSSEEVIACAEPYVYRAELPV